MNEKNILKQPKIKWLDTFLSYSLAIVSMFLTMKLVIKWLSGHFAWTIDWWLNTLLFAVPLGAAIDLIKTLSIILLVVFSYAYDSKELIDSKKQIKLKFGRKGLLNYAIVSYAISLLFSLFASHSELGIRAYEIAKTSTKYTEASGLSEVYADEIKINNKTIEVLNEKLSATRFHNKQDQFQADIDKLTNRNKELTEKMESTSNKKIDAVNDGNTETFFLDNTIRSIIGSIGINVSIKFSNFILGFLLEILVYISVYFWAIRNIYVIILRLNSLFENSILGAVTDSIEHSDMSNRYLESRVEDIISTRLDIKNKQTYEKLSNLTGNMEQILKILNQGDDTEIIDIKKSKQRRLSTSSKSSQNEHGIVHSGSQISSQQVQNLVNVHRNSEPNSSISSKDSELNSELLNKQIEQGLAILNDAKDGELNLSVEGKKNLKDMYESVQSKSKPFIAYCYKNIGLNASTIFKLYPMITGKKVSQGYIYRIIREINDENYKIT